MNSSHNFPQLPHQLFQQIQINPQLTHASPIMPSQVDHDHIDQSIAPSHVQASVVNPPVMGILNPQQFNCQHMLMYAQPCPR